MNAPDAAAKAQSVHVYIEGLLAQARLRNDVGVLRGMERGILDILGVKAPTSAAA